MHQTPRALRALVVLLSSLAALMSAPALAVESDHLPPALGVVGKFHLLVLHFPIALLVSSAR